MDQQTLWNDLFLNPVEHPGSPVFAGDGNIPFIDLDSDDPTDFSFWNNDSLSLGTHVGTERGHSWASPLIINERTEERQLETTNMLLGSRTDTGRLEDVNINLNSNLADAGQSFSQNPDFIQNSIPHIPVSSGTVNVPPPFVLSNPSITSSRVEGRPTSSFDGRRLSYKRKSIESSGSSSSCLYRSDNSLVHSNTALGIGSSSNYPSGINLNGEHQNARINSCGNLGFSDSHTYNFTERGESSQRNCRSRINLTSNQWVPGNNLGSSNLWTPHQASNLLVPFDQSSGASNSQPRTLPVPQVVQYTRSFPSIPAPPSSRARISLRSPAIVENSAFNSSSSPAIVENSASVHPTGARQQMQHSRTSWSQAPPTSQAGTSSHVHLSGPGWIPCQIPDAVHHSVIPSGGSGSGQTINGGPPQPPSLPSNLQEMRYQNAAAAAVRSLQQQYVMPAGSVQVSPASLRAVAAARENRRMLSELRNAFQVARRGGRIQLEDVLFDHAVFYAAPTDFHDRHRDMRLDVDNMSYEELLALEERIGNVNTGLSEETVMKRLKQRRYISLTDETPGEVEPCCVCQEEYGKEDDVGRLDCGHDFHTACIKQWLMLKNLCPICKTTGLVT